jgi:hypothetical protein
MTTFTINAENTITAFPTPDHTEAANGQPQLAELAEGDPVYVDLADWDRVVYCFPVLLAPGAAAAAMARGPFSFSSSPIRRHLCGWSPGDLGTPCRPVLFSFSRWHA